MEYFTVNTLPKQQYRIVKGEKWTLTDESGNQYLDLCSTSANMVLGHTNHEMNEALKKQVEELWFVPSLFQHQAYFDLCELLVKQTPPGISAVNARQCNGTDCVDTAIKMALLHTRRKKILCLTGAYHGASLSTMPLCWVHRYNRRINHILDIEYSERPTISSLLQLVQQHPDAAAVVFDPAGVKQGVFTPSLIKDDVHRIRKFCTENGITLIMDEVQTFGFMGESLFASTVLDVVPDIICLGKALGCGVPIAATLCKDEYRAVIPKNEAEYTCGGQPLTCVAAVQSIKIMLSLKEETTKNLAGLTSLVNKLAQQFPHLTFTQSGFMVGIGRKDGMYVKPWASWVCKLALDDRIIIRMYYFTLLLKPPIITPFDVLEGVFTKLAQILETCERELAVPSQHYTDLTMSKCNLTPLTRIKKEPPLPGHLESMSAVLAHISPNLSARKSDATEQVQLSRKLFTINIPSLEIQNIGGCLEHTYQSGIAMDAYITDHSSSDPALVNGLVLKHQLYVEMAHDAGISLPNRQPGNALVNGYSLTLVNFDMTYCDSTNSTSTLFAFEEVFSSFQCVSCVKVNPTLQQDLADRLCYGIVQRQGQLAITVWESMIEAYKCPNDITLPESLSHSDYLKGIGALNKGFKNAYTLI